MANISVKDVPEQWADALRQRAALNHRSLQGELMFLIEQAVGGSRWQMRADGGAIANGQRMVAGIDGQGYPIIRQGWKTIEQIAQEHRQKFPEPIRGGPLAVDIIREDRDSR